MSNIKVNIQLVDGSDRTLHEKGESCSSLIETLCGNDIRPPPRNMKIKVFTKSMKVVEIIIPNEREDEAIVKVDGETL